MGIWDVAVEGGFDVGEEVAFGDGVGGADGAGANAEFGESATEPPFVDFAAAAEVFPGAIVPWIEDGD